MRLPRGGTVRGDQRHRHARRRRPVGDRLMPADTGIRGKVAIVGLGHTAQGKLPGRRPSRTRSAAMAALADAGIAPAGWTAWSPASPSRAGNDVAVGPLLGLNPPYAQSLDYGTCNFSLHLAVMAIITGMASTVRSPTGRMPVASGSLRRRPGPTWPRGRAYAHRRAAGMALQRHKHLYGTTDEQFGMMAVVQREWAQKNPIAMFREPMTMANTWPAVHGRAAAPGRRHDDLRRRRRTGRHHPRAGPDYPNEPVYVLGISEHPGSAASTTRST